MSVSSDFKNQVAKALDDAGTEYRRDVTFTDDPRRGATMTVAATAQLVRLHVPSEEEFGDEAFTPAADLESLASVLIDQHPATFGHLNDLEIAFLWKKSGGKRGGHGVFGKTSKRSGLVAAFTTADFIIWLAADHVTNAEYTPAQIKALLHHEMLHIGWQEPDEDDQDGEGKSVLVGHDFEGFVHEIKTYGAWDELSRAAASAFEQAPLFSE